MDIPIPSERDKPSFYYHTELQRIRNHVLRGYKVIDPAKNTADKANDISDKYAIHFLPTKYLIDKKGNIVCKINEGEDAKLDAMIEKLLNEK